MPRPRYEKIAFKSRAACIAAVETFNRVSVPYREEAFVILMMNAWELLLKAKIIKSSQKGIRDVFVFEWKTNEETGRKRNTQKTARSGAPMTIGIEKCLNLVRSMPDGLDSACAMNIETLMEVRDNATHFVNDDVMLKKVITEIVLASVKNYVIAAQRWFGMSFSDLNISTIPLSFDLDQRVAEAVARRSSEDSIKFIEYVNRNERELGPTEGIFAYTVEVRFDLMRKSCEEAVKSNSVKEAPSLTVKYEPNVLPNGMDIEYKSLLSRLKNYYSNFKPTPEFHARMVELKKDDRLAVEIFNDPLRKKNGKFFYNANIIRRFEDMFTRR